MMIRALLILAALATTPAAAAEPARYRADVSEGPLRATVGFERGPDGTRWLLVCWDDTPGHPPRVVVRKGVAPDEAEWVMGEDRSPTGGTFTLALRPTALLFMATSGLDGCPRAGVPVLKRVR
jgi:hypothetical protein